MSGEHANQDDAGRSARARSVPGKAALALGIAAGWIVLEVALRRGVVPELASVVGGPFAADWTVMVVGFPLVAALLGWIAARSGRPPEEWGYDWSLRPVVAGVLGIAVALVVAAVAAQVDAFFLPLERVGTSFGAAVGDALRAAPALAALFLIGNGIVVPIAEEAVWRGMVQSELVEAWGVPAGIALTAILFAVKHVIVDLSVVRVTTLLALGLVFGLLRHRFGTASSTITHAGVNTVGTASVIAVSLA